MCAHFERVIIGTAEGAVAWFDKNSIGLTPIKLKRIENFASLGNESDNLTPVIARIGLRILSAISESIKRITPIAEIGFCVHYDNGYSYPVLFNLKGECKVGSGLVQLEDPIWLENGQVYDREKGLKYLEFSDNWQSTCNAALTPIRKLLNLFISSEAPL